MAETARPEAVTAGIGIRMLAAGYDLLILLSISMIVVGIPLTLSDALFGSKPPQWLQNLLFTTVAYAYFVGFWQKAGQTTGMRPWKLRIAMVDSGDNPGFASASIRFLGLMLTWLAFLLIVFYLYALNTNNVEIFDRLVGALPGELLVPVFLVVALLPPVNLLLMMITPHRQTLYDMAAGTGVYRLQQK